MKGSVMSPWRSLNAIRCLAVQFAVILLFSFPWAVHATQSSAIAAVATTFSFPTTNGISVIADDTSTPSFSSGAYKIDYSISSSGNVQVIFTFNATQDFSTFNRFIFYLRSDTPGNDATLTAFLTDTGSNQIKVGGALTVDLDYTGAYQQVTVDMTDSAAGFSGTQDAFSFASVSKFTFVLEDANTSGGTVVLYIDNMIFVSNIKSNPLVFSSSPSSGEFLRQPVGSMTAVINDLQGIDSSTISVFFNGDTFGVQDSEISFNNGTDLTINLSDTLNLASFFGKRVRFSVYAKDIIGNSMDELRYDFFIGPPSNALIDRVRFSSNPFSPNGDGINDNLTITYTLLSQNATVTYRIRNAAGRAVFRTTPITITNRGDQTFIWDARTNRSHRVPIGFYIWEAEVMDNNTGGRSTIRKVVGVVK